MPTLIETAVSRRLQARRDARPVAAVNLPDAAAYAVHAGVASELDWFADAQRGHWKSGGKSRVPVRWDEAQAKRRGHHRHLVRPARCPRG